jgi:hypothetical protein
VSLVVIDADRGECWLAQVQRRPYFSETTEGISSFAFIATGVIGLDQQTRTRAGARTRSRSSLSQAIATASAS